MPGEKLYFIAIVLSPLIAAQIEVFRQDMANTYNSKAALKVMPHITLKAPFKLPSGEKSTLLEWFRYIKVQGKAFEVLLENFGSFDNNYSKVIYVKPVMSTQLQNLQSVVMNSFNVAYPKINTPAHEQHFNPHITIAYRDLTPQNFEKSLGCVRY